MMYKQIYTMEQLTSYTVERLIEEYQFIQDIAASLEVYSDDQRKSENECLEYMSDIRKRMEEIREKIQ